MEATTEPLISCSFPKAGPAVQQGRALAKQARPIASVARAEVQRRKAARVWLEPGAGRTASAGAGGSAEHAGSGGTSGVAARAGRGGTTGSGAGSAGSGGTPNPLCGNGQVDLGEQCDRGRPIASEGGTGGGSEAVAGTSSGGPSGLVEKYGQLCSNTCQAVGTRACFECEAPYMVDNCLGSAEAPFTEAQQAACFSVMRCIQKSNCFDGTATFGTKCYCGSLPIAACSGAPYTGPGSPDGPCVQEIQAGLSKSASNVVVLGNLTSTSYPSGAAMLRLSCQRDCDSRACADRCGFTIGGAAFP